MKIVIQRPLIKEGEGPVSKTPVNFVNEVFEVQLRPLEEARNWFVLESIKATGAALAPDDASLAFIHKGFFDCHLHATWMGLRAGDLDLQHVEGVEDINRLVREKLAQGAKFVRGHGWDESKFGLTLDSMPRILEDLLPETVPVFLFRNCGHSAFANRLMRQKAGATTLGPLITDKDLNRFSDVLPIPSLADCKEAFLWTQERLLKEGVTAIGEMSMDETLVHALKSVCETGELLLDVQGCFDAGRAPSVETQGPLQCLNAGAVGPLDRKALFQVKHWKRYLDGSFGSRTAWLTRSYEDFESFGESLVGSDQLLLECRTALQNGFHLSFHAIGDASLDQALEMGDRLSKLMESRRYSDAVLGHSVTRHRIEHGQLIRDDQLERLARQNFWMLCSQPGHRVSDDRFIRSRLGSERARNWAYRAGALIESGVPVGLSSDAPIDSYSPEHVIRSAMEHPVAREALSFAEALWWYTTGSRLELGLQPGKIKVGSTVYLSDPKNI